MSFIILCLCFIAKGNPWFKDFYDQRFCSEVRMRGTGGAPASPGPASTSEEQTALSPGQKMWVSAPAGLQTEIIEWFIIEGRAFLRSSLVLHGCKQRVLTIYRGPGFLAVSWFLHGCKQRVLKIYRGLCFLAVVWFGSTLTSFSPSPVRKLPLFLSFPVYRRSSLLTGEEGRRGWAWSQIKQPQENLALCNIVNTLCFQPWRN